jgi:predicted nucleotidyltransferase
MDKKTVKKIVLRFGKEVKKQLPVKSIILYGSYINGKPHEDSDIDVAVVMEESKYSFLKVNTILQKIMWNIDTRIEPIVMSSKFSNKDFFDHVMKTGLEIRV